MEALVNRCLIQENSTKFCKIDMTERTGTELIYVPSLEMPMSLRTESFAFMKISMREFPSVLLITMELLPTDQVACMRFQEFLVTNPM